MKKAAFKAVFIILLMIFLAGCTGRQVKTVSDDGLVINSFFPDYDEIESKRNVRLYMEVENLGGTDATNVEAQLFGISWDNNEQKSEIISSISAPELRRGMPGGVKTFFWNLVMPNLPQGTSNDYAIKGRVTYTYHTTATANIPVLNEDEYQRRKLTGGTAEFITTTNTNAPIKVDITGPEPVVVRKSAFGKEDEETFLKIRFRNVGSGIPITNDINGLITGNIRIDGYGIAKIDCFGNYINSGNSINIKLPVNDKEGIILRRGEDVTEPCTIYLSRELWDAKAQGTLTLVFDLSYKYYIDAVTNIRVIGIKQTTSIPLEETI